MALGVEGRLMSYRKPISGAIFDHVLSQAEAPAHREVG